MKFPRFTPRSHHFALAATLILAAFLAFFRLGQEGAGNIYYTAAVQAMLLNGHNFFFVSADPIGLVMVDKPPLGLWVQAASAMVFGFSGWSVIAPQGAAFVASVGLVYALVKRVFGAWPGVMAALIMALTPINVAASRNNTMDMQLVMTSLLAGWAFSIAAEQGKLRWVLIGGALVGVGFNIKMGQAHLVLPGLIVLYLVSAPVSMWRRIWHAGAGLALILIISFSWVAAVDLTPADQRPYVGSSGNNTMMGLILGHNAEKRLPQLQQLLNPSPTPPGQPGYQQPPPGAPGPAGPGIMDEIGAPGLLRMFNKPLGGQASWLLVVAIISAIAIGIRGSWRSTLTREQQSMILWAGWLLPQLVVFSFGGLIHRYYLVMMAPGVAALAAGGAAVMWEEAQSESRMRWMLPAAILISAGIEAILIMPWEGWLWIIPVMGVLCAAGTGIIGWAMASRGVSKTSLATGVAVSVAGLLIAPAVWSAITAAVGGDATLPYAGPELMIQKPQRMGLGNKTLIGYLIAHQERPDQVVGTISAIQAGAIALNGQPAVALGGFNGTDKVLTIEQLEMMVRSGQMRFVWITPPERPGPPGQGGGLPIPPGLDANSDLIEWVFTHCAVAQTSEGPPPPIARRPPGSPPLEVLFDCGRSR